MRKFFTDRDDKIAIWQMPNLPLIAWFIFLVLAKAAPSGDWQLWAGYASAASLLVWSILEIGWGASYFRRALGAAVLTTLILSRL